MAKKNTYKVSMGRPEGRRPKDSLDVTESIILNESARNKKGWCGLDLYGSLEGSCEHGNEPSGSLKWWGILQYQRNWWFLKKD
jgi:hypothetical protein